MRLKYCEKTKESFEAKELKNLNNRIVEAGSGRIVIDDLSD